MKNLFFTIFLFSSLLVNSQQYVTFYYNPELQAQVTANHALRLSNEELMRQKYIKIKEKYEDINEKIAQVIVIRNQLHGYLTNVHSLIANGQQLKRTYADLVRLYNNLAELSRISATKPQYAILCTKTYNKVYLKALECQQYISGVVLKEDPRLLIDMNNRTYFLAKVQNQIRDLNLLVYSITLFIRNAETVPYWRNIEGLNTIITHDAEMLRHIISQAKLL